jgi:hypothetical protein
MFVSRFRFVMWMTFFMSRASISAMNWFGFGGATKNKGFPWEKGKP